MRVDSPVFTSALHVRASVNSRLRLKCTSGQSFFTILLMSSLYWYNMTHCLYSSVSYGIIAMNAVPLAVVMDLYVVRCMRWFWTSDGLCWWYTAVVRMSLSEKR